MNTGQHIAQALRALGSAKTVRTVPDVAQYVRIVTGTLTDDSCVYGLCITDALTGAEITLPCVDYATAEELYTRLVSGCGCKGRS